MTKIEYDEDKWMEQEINLSKEFASHFDGRCFLDLDMYSERIEAYVKYDMLVVEGRITSMDEFKEHYQE